MEQFWLAFIPMFFAMDPVGLLPIFVGLTQEMDKAQKQVIVLQSVVTASAVAIGFAVLGRAVFHFMGITMGDFMVAGGAILFCLSILDLIAATEGKRLQIKDVGAVPIGTPLVVGPGVLTMTLMLIDQHGLGLALSSVLSNIMIVGVVFLIADVLIRLLGVSGARALSKVMSLLLAAFGVMMIRRGILAIIAQEHLPL